MKRILTFVLVICLAVTVVMLAGCDKRDPLEKFYDEMNETESFRVEMTVNAMGMKVTETLLVDGNIQHTLESDISNESYLVETENGVTEYVKNVFGKWVKNTYVPTEDDELDVFDEEMEALFDPLNFDIEENNYTQKDDVEFESFKDVVITLDEEKCTIEMTMVMEGIGVDTTLKITKLGEVNESLPKGFDTVDIEESNKTSKEALQSNGFQVERYTTGAYNDAILESFGAPGADAIAIVVGEKGNDSVILVYCSDAESAEAVHDAFYTMLDTSFDLVVEEYGTDSDEYREFYDLNKDTVIGRDGNIVCFATSLDALNKAK